MVVAVEVLEKKAKKQEPQAMVVMAEMVSVTLIVLVHQSAMEAVAVEAPIMVLLARLA